MSMTETFNAANDLAHPGRGGTTEVPRSSITRIVGALAFVELTSGLVQGFVSTMIPSLGTKLSIGAAQLGWINIVQLLATAVCVPVFGRLGDVHGHRRMLRIAVLSVCVGSFLVALAPSWQLLLTGRFLQGAIGAFLPLEFAIVRDKLKGSSAAGGVARLIACLTLGVSLGAIFAGLLREKISNPQVVLLVPAILTLGCVAVVFWLIPESTTRAGHHLDLPAMTLFGLGLASLLLGVAQGPKWGWANGLTLLCLTAGIALLIGFVLVELRTDEPMVDVRFLVRRELVPLYLGALFIGVAIFGAQTAGLSFLATSPKAGYGFGLVGVGLSVVSTLALALPMFFTNALAGPLVARGRGREVVIAGFVIGAIGYFGLATMHGSMTEYIVSSVISGLGIGLALTAMPALIVDRAPRDRTGSAASVYQVGRNVGGSIGGAAFAAVLAAHTPLDSRVPAVDGYTTVWVICGAVFVLAAVVVAAVRVRREVPAVDEPVPPAV